MRDLVVVTADADALALIRTIVPRYQSLGIARVNTEERDFIKDVLHDSSPPEHVVELLAVHRTTHRRALILRDLEGSGFETRGATVLEIAIADALHRAGWERERIEAVVIEPEVEAWLRFESPHMGRVVRRRSRKSGAWTMQEFELVRTRVQTRYPDVTTTGKPARPKEVFNGILHEYRIPHSASLYADLAETESLHGCTVSSFNRVVDTLRRWFPPEA